MIEPVLADEAFLDNVRAATLRRSGFRLWWLGQSGFLIQWERRHLLLDPYLSDSLTNKYEKSDKPHVRMTRRVVDPARLDFIDVVTSSHNHTDHLDAETLKPLLGAHSGLKIVVAEANRSFVAERLGIDTARLIGVDDGKAVEAGGFVFDGIASAHETIEKDEQGRCKFLGFVVQFGLWTLYHSGDTVLYDGLVERLRKFKIDVALLPINGADPARRVAGNLNGREAAQLAKDIGARMVIPCHYEMFEFNTASPDEQFVPVCQRLGQAYRVLKCGERWESYKLK